MNVLTKLDWLSFTFSRELTDHITRLVTEVYQNEESQVGSRWHKKVYRCWQNDKNRFFLLKTHPRVASGKPEIEMTGSWFHTRESEDDAHTLLRTCEGRINRLDVAVDFRVEYPGEVGFWEEFRSVVPKRGKNFRDYFDGDEEWTGRACGYGRGSEVALRIYDKAKERAGKNDPEESGLGWWRVEISLRGDTMKGQNKEWYLDSLGNLHWVGFAFLADRYEGWPGFFKPFSDYEIRPRPRGLAGVEGKVLYWQRRIELAQRKLSDINSDVNPLEEVNGKQLFDHGDSPGEGRKE